MKRSVVDIFKNAVDKYISYFSLKRWGVNYSIVDDETMRAATSTDQENMMVLFSIDKHWIKENPPTDEIKLVAFHEVMEVLLSPITDKLRTIYSVEEIAKEIHSIIVLFENVVFPLIK